MELDRKMMMLLLIYISHLLFCSRDLLKDRQPPALLPVRHRHVEQSQHLVLDPVIVVALAPAPALIRRASSSVTAATARPRRMRHDPGQQLLHFPDDLAVLLVAGLQVPPGEHVGEDELGVGEPGLLDEAEGEVARLVGVRVDHLRLPVHHLRRHEVALLHVRPREVAQDARCLLLDGDVDLAAVRAGALGGPAMERLAEVDLAELLLEQLDLLLGPPAGLVEVQEDVVQRLLGLLRAQVPQRPDGVDGLRQVPALLHHHRHVLERAVQLVARADRLPEPRDRRVQVLLHQLEVLGPRVRPVAGRDLVRDVRRGRARRLSHRCHGDKLMIIHASSY
uniref:Secreted protein n=1 Tax=Zea mays TaxID=4577 RepID=C4J3F1_MAIZE|nr:unknown [Zea mays]